MNLKKKTMATAFLTAVMLITGASAAWANDCVNLSRSAGNNTAFTEKGQWFLVDIPELGGLTWVFATPDNFAAGKYDALLDGAECPRERFVMQWFTQYRQGHEDPLKGIWTEACIQKAIPGF